MSEFPFPPERLWQQYEDGVSPGPPPPAPVLGDFMIFGAALQTQEPAGLLEASNIPKHFDSSAEAVADGNGPGSAALGSELTKLNSKLMSTFLELLDEMINNPTIAGLDPSGKPIDDWVPLASTKSLEVLKELFLNFHHLLNSHRPAQAKEHLLRLLQEQQSRRVDANGTLLVQRQGLEQQLAASIRQLRATGLKDIQRLCATAAAATVPVGAAAGAAEAAAATEEVPKKRKAVAAPAAAAAAPPATAEEAAAAGAGAEAEDERLRKHLKQ